MIYPLSIVTDRLMASRKDNGAFEETTAAQAKAAKTCRIWRESVTVRFDSLPAASAEVPKR